MKNFKLLVLLLPSGLYIAVLRDAGGLMKFREKLVIAP